MRRAGIPAGIGVACAVLLGLGPAATAHELWVLTPDQVMAWALQDKSATLTGAAPHSSLIILLSALILAALLALHDRLPFWLPARLQRSLWDGRGALVAGIRIGLGLTLLVLAFGLEPVAGVERGMVASLLAPDLVLSRLDGIWSHLWVLEGLLGMALVLGVATPIVALATSIFIPLAFVLFGPGALAYVPTYLGILWFLARQGGGALTLAMPAALRAPVRAGDFERDLAIMRIAIGLNFLGLGLYFKALNPSLAVALLEENWIPVLSAMPETAVLLMTIIEVTAGTMLTFGMFSRAIAVILIGGFFFFAAFLDETVLAHLIFYGPLAMIAALGGGSLGVIRPQASNHEIEHLRDRLQAMRQLAEREGWPFPSDRELDQLQHKGELLGLKVALDELRKRQLARRAQELGGARP